MTDKETGNAALVAAIDRLTTEVAGVRAALEGRVPAASPVPKAAAANMHVAAQAVAAVASLAPSLAPSLATASSERQADEVEQLLAFVFMAALDNDREAGFENFVSAMHSDRTDAPRSIPSLREFNWKALRKNVSRYLSEPGDATSFEIVMRRPEKWSAEDKNGKVFLACPNRSPVPITLKRDPRHEDAWRITDSSL